MFSLYIDPARLDPEALFPEETMRYIAYVKQAKAAPPSEETLVPGEPEERTRAERLTHGVPLASETWHFLLEAAQSVGLDQSAILRSPASAK
jgi:uncharacterized oxidoreductase